MKKIIITLLIGTGFLLSCDAQKNTSNTQTETNDKFTLTIDVDEFSQLISDGNTQLLDVRTPEEVAQGKIKDAINVNVMDGNFTEGINQFDKNKPIFVYCKSGGRSAKAMNEMASLGFKKIYNLNGGITKWQSNGFKITK